MTHPVTPWLSEFFLSLGLTFPICKMTNQTQQKMLRSFSVPIILVFVFLLFFSTLSLLPLDLGTAHGSEGPGLVRLIHLRSGPVRVILFSLCHLSIKICIHFHVKHDVSKFYKCTWQVFSVELSITKPKCKIQTQPPRSLYKTRCYAHITKSKIKEARGHFFHSSHFIEMLTWVAKDVHFPTFSCIYGRGSYREEPWRTTRQGECFSLICSSCPSWDECGWSTPLSHNGLFENNCSNWAQWRMTVIPALCVTEEGGLQSKPNVSNSVTYWDSVSK